MNGRKGIRKAIEPGRLPHIWQVPSITALLVLTIWASVALPPLADGIYLSAETSISLPNDAGLIDVKSRYGAKGDGVTDDTNSIKRAIAENVGLHRTLLFPAGTYIVSSTLDWRNRAGQWRSYLTLQGEGIDRTTLKLKDSTMGFTNTRTPRAVVRPASKTDDPACSNYAQDSGDGGGNCAFGNYLLDMTINAGSGNYGAIGIDFIASNWGGIVNTRVTTDDGRGATGISLQREVGPALLKNVHVNGFDNGIVASRELYGITLEHITLTNQRQAGIKNQGNMLAIRDVKSTNKVPAIVNEISWGVISVVDSLLEGGDSTATAIDNRGALFARSIRATGYRAAVKNGGVVVPGMAITEYASQAPKSLFSSTGSSLNLPTQETPEFNDSVLANWSSVATYGARKDDGVDDSAAIQAAIDSGKETVYLPFGRYTVNRTVIIRGRVKRIIGFSSEIVGSANPAFRVEALASAFVTIERLRLRTLEHASQQKVVVKHVQGWNSSYTGRPDMGPWFFEDYCCGKIDITNRTVWARQLNVETDSAPQIQNSGGTLWILGLKTERSATNISTVAGGRTEVLGALLYPVQRSANRKAFILRDAFTSMTYKEVAYADDRDFDIHVEETRSGLARQLLRNEVQRAGSGALMPLYTSVVSRG